MLNFCIISKMIPARQACALLLMLILTACETIPGTPYMVSWSNSQVEIDTYCKKDNWKQSCGNWDKERGLQLAQKYCSRSGLKAHPDYFTQCARRNTETKCISSGGYSSCKTENECTDYHIFYNCL